MVAPVPMAHRPRSNAGLAVDSDTLWMALALVLVIEGLFPFISPANWRRMLAQLLQMSDGQIRTFAMASISVGLLMIWLLAP